MFKKLNINFDNITINDFIGKQKTNSYVSFYEFDIKDQSNLDSLIKSKIKFNISPDSFNITKIDYPGSSPHTDLWQTALNIYITAGNDKTYFWKKRDNSRLITNTNTNFYYKNIQLAGMFIANKGDCYLLNTHVIHSVEVKQSSRYILRFYWMNYNFEEVESSIILI